MVDYSQARFDVCRDGAALAQQQPLQYFSCSCFLLYARPEQPRRHRGHKLNLSQERGSATVGGAKPPWLAERATPLVMRSSSIKRNRCPQATALSSCLR